jgi:hypothetical protein
MTAGTATNPVPALGRRCTEPANRLAADTRLEMFMVLGYQNCHQTAPRPVGQAVRRTRPARVGPPWCADRPDLRFPRVAGRVSKPRRACGQAGRCARRSVPAQPAHLVQPDGEHDRPAEVAALTGSISGNCSASAAAPSAAIRSSSLIICLLPVQSHVPLVRRPRRSHPPVTVSELVRFGIASLADHRRGPGGRVWAPPGR